MNLHAACLAGDVALASRAIDRGDAVERTDLGGWRPLHLAAQGDHAALVSLLLARGASPDRRSDNPGGCDGATPLHVASVMGSLSAARRLLDAGASPDHRDDAGFTPLLIAASRGDLAFVRLLLRSGADPDRSLDDSTPLDLARGGGHRAVAALLRQCCASASTSR